MRHLYRCATEGQSLTNPVPRHHHDAHQYTQDKPSWITHWYVNADDAYETKAAIDPVNA